MEMRNGNRIIKAGLKAIEGMVRKNKKREEGEEYYLDW